MKAINSEHRKRNNRFRLVSSRKEDKYYTWYEKVGLKMKRIFNKRWKKKNTLERIIYVCELPLLSIMYKIKIFLSHLILDRNLVVPPVDKPLLFQNQILIYPFTSLAVIFYVYGGFKRQIDFGKGFSLKGVHIYTVLSVLWFLLLIIFKKNSWKPKPRKVEKSKSFFSIFSKFRFFHFFIFFKLSCSSSFSCQWWLV